MHLDQSNSEFPFILGEYKLMVMPAAPEDSIGLSGIGTGRSASSMRTRSGA
jgi:hypothetical protein